MNNRNPELLEVNNYEQSPPGDPSATPYCPIEPVRIAFFASLPLGVSLKKKTQGRKDAKKCLQGPSRRGSFNRFRRVEHALDP